MAERNLFDEPLKLCSREPMTGFLRDGYCRPASSDSGNHLVCAELSKEFLDFTESRGNRLSGLGPGDRWCLCARRWKEAADAGVVARVIPEATSKQALRFAPELELQADLYAAHRREESGVLR
jgi:uncharacterized protein